MKKSLEESIKALQGKFSFASSGRKKLYRFDWLMTGEDDLSAALADEDKKVIRTIKLAAAGLALLLVCSLFTGRERPLEKEIARPLYGSDPLEINAVASASWSGEKGEYPVTLQVNPAALDEESADALFDQCREALLQVMPGDNPDLDHVFSDLKLPESYRSKAVLLSWESSRPEILADDGSVSLLGVPQGACADLYCMMMAGEYSKECCFKIGFDPSRADKKELLKAAVEREVERIGGSEDGSALVLPSEAAGIEYSWTDRSTEAFFPVLSVGLLILLYLWTGRYEGLQRSLKKKKNLFEDQIQDMITQLILLLDAGLVLTSAFDQLLEGNKDGGPLYKAMRDVKIQCDSVNVPYTSALYSYAVTTGCRDFIRFAALAEDSRSHGSELSEKLQQENARMRDHRLNRVKARSKEAETKLCMPLMLLLLSLLAIAAGPVLLEMQ